MKNFEIDLHETLSALALNHGFNEAIHMAFEEKYGEEYLLYSNAAWEKSESPSMKLRMEYKIEQ